MCDVHPELRSKVLLLSSKKYLPKFIIRRLNCDYNLEKELIKKKDVIKNIIGSSDARWLFCPCGVNPLFLKRAYEISEYNNLKTAFYFVDDIEDSCMLSGDKNKIRICSKYMDGWMKKADKIFSISYGLKNAIKKRYGVDSIVLPLSYEINKKYKLHVTDMKNQIIFVGSPGHFYIEGLKKLIGIVDQINDQYNYNITFRLTMFDQETIKTLFGEHDFIRSGILDSKAKLVHEISSSLFCVAPYSFKNEYKNMVSTSFPSKLLEYLCYAKAILIISPDYSSSVQYFKLHELEKVITIDDRNIIKNAILEQYKERNDYSNKYQSIIEDVHDPKRTSQIIVDALNG